MKYLLSVILAVCILGTSSFAAEMKPWEKKRAEKKKLEAWKERKARQEAEAKKAKEVGSIKKKDKDIMQNRVESKDFDMVAFGPAWFVSPEHAPNDPAFQFGLGRLWEVTPNAAVKLKSDVVVDPGFDAFMGSLSLGSNYYFTATNFSPFLGADLGLGYGGASTPKEWPDQDAYFFGFTMGVSGGVILFRTSSTHLIIEPNMQMLMRGSYPITGGIKLTIANSGMFGGF